ncbi:MAG: Trk system potassium transporter TrkA [Bacteroidales bacterium]|jgi:trk system potassium uptake protein TrkA|nr:Trk system potassium transporter TrkA [Bacteroidales bacterium]
MRIVVAGAGEVGTHLAKMLSLENHEMVIIDSDEERLQNLSASCDLLTLEGNVTSKNLLLEAGADKADLFIAVTPSDDTNIVAALIAKKLGAALTVVRVGNDELISRENRNMYQRLGIDSMVYPEKIASREVTNVLHQAGVTNIIDFSGGRLSMLAVRMERNAPIVGKTLEEAGGIYEMEYRAVAVLREGQTIIPRRDFSFEVNDLVYVVTNHAGIKAILKHSGNEWEEMHQVMILGGSHIGRLIAKDLGKRYRIKIFEANREKAYRLSDMFNNALIIHGDGTQIDLLVDEGLKNTDAFVAVTGDSEANILSCLLAKSMGVRHTVAEVEKLDYINLAERLGVTTIINKKLIAAAHIYRYTLSGTVSKIKHLTLTDAEALEFIVSPKSEIIRHPLNKTCFPEHAIIGGVVRGTEGFVATGETQIQPGDHVVVFAMPQAVNAVSNLFK